MHTTKYFLCCGGVDIIALMVHSALEKKPRKETRGGRKKKKSQYSVMGSDFRKLRLPVTFPETRLPPVPAEHTQMDAQIGSRKRVKCGLKGGLHLTFKLCFHLA